MFNGTARSRRLWMGSFGAMALVAGLSSCAKEAVVAKKGDYVAIEFIQGAEEYRDLAPTIYLDVPAGFKFRGAVLAEGDVADYQEHLPDAEDFAREIEEIEKYGMGGFTGPNHDVAMLINVYHASVFAVGVFEESVARSLYRKVATPEQTMMHPKVSETPIAFGNYVGKVTYTRMDANQKDGLISLLSGDSAGTPMQLGFDCCTGLSVEEVTLGAKSDEYYIVIEFQIYGENNSMPEMVDVARRIAESIRIKE